MVIRYNAEEEEMWVGGAEQRESSGERERWFRVRGYFGDLVLGVAMGWG